MSEKSEKGGSLEALRDMKDLTVVRPPLAPRMYSFASTGRTSSTQPNESNGPKKYPLRQVQALALREAELLLEEWRSSLPSEARAFAESLQPLKPHPIVKLGAEIAAELTEAEHQARRELRYLARRWERKLRPPMLVANRLRQQGALWRLKGAGAC